jgi:hypothetical protein
MLKEMGEGKKDKIAYRARSAAGTEKVDAVDGLKGGDSHTNGGRV